LQKIGQVLARNRHFDPRFRRALSELENGISDVSAADICSIISTELGPRIKRYGVKMDSAILAEASVSAVLRFTWRNPANGRRERGVFKVLKPHIPACYAEDMKILQQLAGHLARKYVGDRSRFAGIAETLTEIRLLLRHEVDFRREQRTLGQAQRFYGSVPGVRVPRLIEPLSTASVTALTEENGVKVTDALKRRPGPRARLAERLVETLIAVPAFAREEEAIFHGDPHAGNLLYDKRRDELVILDWALKESLGRDQRRQLLRLVLMTILRDPDGISAAIEQLRLHLLVGDRTQARAVKESVNRFLRSLSLLHLPGPMDALHLLDSAAREGVRFPAPLVMFRKAAFTLDGVVEDVAGATVRMDSVLGRYVMRNSVDAAATLWSLLSARDWAALEWSALTLAARLPGQALSRYWTIPGTFGSLSFRQREA
jgi:ubiquinone biosynthesis protein